MRLKNLSWSGVVVGAICGLAALGTASAQDSASSYAKMAPLHDYLIADRDAEIAFARSAAPPNISRDAEVLVLGEKGYSTAVPGKSGFVCLIERSWAKDTDDPEFWNPKMRAPVCLNQAAAQAHLTLFRKKTEWVLAGLSKEEISAKVKAGFASGEFVSPSLGAMSYMMGKDGYLSDSDRHWHPHLMFFLPLSDPSGWGANLDGSPVQAFQDREEHATIFFVPLGHWSDSSPDSATH